MGVLVNEMERNANGRIMKVRERDGNVQTVNYVVHKPSRLVAQQKRVAGKFTREKTFSPMVCNSGEATGWMVNATVFSLAQARAILALPANAPQASILAAALAA